MLEGARCEAALGAHIPNIWLPVIILRFRFREHEVLGDTKVTTRTYFEVVTNVRNGTHDVKKTEGEEISNELVEELRCLVMIVGFFQPLVSKRGRSKPRFNMEFHAEVAFCESIALWDTYIKCILTCLLDLACKTFSI